MVKLEQREASDGFTLVELLVVIVLISILATIALTVILDQRRKGWDAAIESDLRNAATVQYTVLTEGGGGEFAGDMATLEGAGFRHSPDVNYFGAAFAMTVTATSGESFCMTARSASGRYVGYSSWFGLVRSLAAPDVITCS